MMKKNILVTGATGTVGLEVIKLLIEQKENYAITAFDIQTKRTKKLLKPFENRIEIVYGDLGNAADVRKVCKEKDAVIHLAAIIPPLADEKPTLAHRVNVVGTQNLIEGLEEFSPHAFFMYSSSISVYGDRVDKPYISVHDPLLPSEGDEYAKTKIEAEQIIRNSRLNWTIFRLAAIMGNHKMSKLMFHMPLATALEIATPIDTARAFVNGLKHQPQLEGKIFNLGGGAAYQTTYEDFLKQSFDVLGLGQLDWPNKTFAEKNFHCGYYADGDDLEKIVRFRRGTLTDYFDTVSQSTSPITKFFTSLLRQPIKKYLLSKSEPYHAFQHNDKVGKKLFFKE